MNRWHRPDRHEGAAPRGTVLLGLSAGVLLVHLSLLGGGVTGFSRDMWATRDAELPGQTPIPVVEALPADPVMVHQSEVVEPVRTSRVRWILPKAPQPSPSPPVMVVKNSKPAPPPPPPPPEPEPERAVVQESVTAAVEPPPEEEVARVAPAPPEPSPRSASSEEGPPRPAVSDLKPGTVVAVGTVPSAGVGAAEVRLPPARVPPSVRLDYAVRAVSKGADYHGSGRLDWSHDGQKYQATLTAKVLFFNIMNMTSAGRLSENGIAPERFSDSRRGERAAHFERSSGKIRYSNNAPDAVLLPGTQDRLSVNFQLSALFDARPDAYAEGQTLRLPVSSHDEAVLWLFQVGPMGTERLPAGDIVARQLTRSPRKEFDRKVEIWLAPSMAHLPVRMRITERSGDFVDMQLEEVPQGLTLENALPP